MNRGWNFNEKAGDEIDVGKVHLAKRRGEMQNKSATDFKPNLLKNTLQCVMDREVLGGFRSCGIAKAPPHGEFPFDVI